uniref:PH01B031C15.26 protein n=1 Tax=Phyllostachys edulis TaxID=38705 RepID=L0P3Z2_PHYED|nr:PH01B031C15.26 [Phyllostachys edulis]
MGKLHPYPPHPFTRQHTLTVKTNDMMLVIYLSSLIRSVIALHNLINNKMLNKEHEKAEDSKPTTVPTTAGS